MDRVFTEWRPYTNPHTGEHGWISSGGLVRRERPRSADDRDAGEPRPETGGADPAVTPPHPLVATPRGHVPPPDAAHPIEWSAPPANPSAADTCDGYKLPDGRYTPERQALHDKLVADILAHTTPVEHPVAYFLGGGPAAGKTTLVKSGRLGDLANVATVAADDIKALLPEYQAGLGHRDPDCASKVHRESSDVAAQALRETARTRRNVLLDGTGDSGLAKLKAKLDAIRSGGQRVVAHYVTAPIEMAQARALERQAATGRGIPADAVAAIHQDVSRVFPQAVQAGLYDEAHLWDTSQGGEPVEVLRHLNGRTEVLRPDLWEAFLRKAPEYVPNSWKG